MKKCVRDFSKIEIVSFLKYNLLLLRSLYIYLFYILYVFFSIYLVNSCFFTIAIAIAIKRKDIFNHRNPYTFGRMGIKKSNSVSIIIDISSCVKIFESKLLSIYKIDVCSNYLILAWFVKNFFKIWAFFGSIIVFWYDYIWIIFDNEDILI